MATTGTVSVRIESVDYGGGRGHTTMVCYMDWTLSDTNVLTVRYNRSESISGGASTWGICGTRPGYGIYGIVQFSTDGGSSWRDLTSGFKEVSICPSLTNTYNTMQNVVNQFSSVQLTQAGLLRVTYGGNRAPNPSSTLRYSFPSYATTAAEQISVYIPVEEDYTPGAISNGSSWLSHNRSGGKAQVSTGETWNDMETKEGGSGSGEPPEIYHSSSWKNMRKFN